MRADLVVEEGPVFADSDADEIPTLEAAFRHGDVVLESRGDCEMFERARQEHMGVEDVASTKRAQPGLVKVAEAEVESQVFRNRSFPADAVVNLVAEVAGIVPVSFGAL